MACLVERDPPSLVNNHSIYTGDPTTQGALGPSGRARACLCFTGEEGRWGEIEKVGGWGGG